MTIEERLEKLTQRHEGLTLTVELLLHNQREAFDRYDAMIQKFGESIQRNENLLARVIGVVEDLTRIVQNHERRLSDLEGNRE